MRKRLIKTFEELSNFNNVIVPLSIDVEEVVFVYHHDVSQREINDCYETIKKYKDIKVEFKKVDEDSVVDLINENTIIDISGYKYISFVIHELAIKHNLETIYYDSKDEVIKSYREHQIFTDNIYRLKIVDLVKLGGGVIKDNLHNPVKKRETIELINKIIESVSDKYNQFTNFVSKINSYINDNNHHKTSYELNDEVIKNIEGNDFYQKNKDLNLFTINGNCLTFFNEEIREVFIVSGAFLENYIYHKLLDSKCFDDVMMSTTIVFNNEQYKYPVTCELDCLVLKDNNLLFTSIKSNKVDTNDLNEIKVHDCMFGNERSKPVICINNDLNEKKPSIYAKAEELGIYVVDNSDLLDNKLVDKFLSIMNDTYKYDKL